MFRIAIAAAPVVGTCLLASATYGAAPLLAVRTAAQITGWLFVCAVVVALWATVVQVRALGALPRPAFGPAVAGATTLLTGTFVLYLSYFEWSELPVAPPRTHKIADQWPRMPQPYFIPAALQLPLVAANPPVAVAATYSGPALSTRLRPAGAKLLASAPALQAPDDTCLNEQGLWQLFCQEQQRLEYCANRPDDDPVCPSPIPASPLH